MTGLLLLFGMFSVYVAGLVIIAGLANLAGNLYDHWLEAAWYRAYHKRERPQ